MIELPSRSQPVQSLQTSRLEVPLPKQREQPRSQPGCRSIVFLVRMNGIQHKRNLWELHWIRDLGT